MKSRQVSESGPGHYSSYERLLEIKTGFPMKCIVKNLKGRAPALRDMLAPPVRSHQPHTRVGLRIQIDYQHFLFMQLRKRRPDIYDRCGFSNAALKIDESENLRAHRLPNSITRESDVLIKFFCSQFRLFNAYSPLRFYGLHQVNRLGLRRETPRNGKLPVGSRAASGSRQGRGKASGRRPNRIKNSPTGGTSAHLPPDRWKPSCSGSLCRRSRVPHDRTLARCNRLFSLRCRAVSDERRGLARADLVPCGTRSLGRMRIGRPEIYRDFPKDRCKLGEPGHGAQQSGKNDRSKAGNPARDSTRSSRSAKPRDLRNHSPKDRRQRLAFVHGPWDYGF